MSTDKNNEKSTEKSTEKKEINRFLCGCHTTVCSFYGATDVVCEVHKDAGVETDKKVEQLQKDIRVFEGEITTVKNTYAKLLCARTRLINKEMYNSNVRKIEELEKQNLAFTDDMNKRQKQHE